MDIKFKKFNYKKDLESQRKLFKECFPENIGTPVISNEHYLWKFHSSPENPQSYEYVATLDNNIIGYYAVIPYKYKVNNVYIKAGMACDLMTGIQARGRGVFTRLGQFSLGELKKQEISFTTGFPIRPEVIPGHKKVGWSIPFELPMYGKFISLKSFLAGKNLSMFFYVLNPLLKIWNSITNIACLYSKEIKIEMYSEKEIKSINGFESFFANLNYEIPIYLVKDVNFIKWRLGAPQKNYNIIVLRKSNQIIGYSISRKVIKENVPCYGILDIAILKGFENVSKILLRENEKLAKKNNAELILIMIGKNWANKFNFKRNGFLKTPYNFSFIINRLNDSIDKEVLFNENNWHLMWIDSDDL